MSDHTNRPSQATQRPADDTPPESRQPPQADQFASMLARAELGIGDDMCRLGDAYREGTGGVRPNSRRAFVWYARSALAGDSFGQNNLGACHEHGIGCDQSYARALKWYQAAVLQGHPTAAMNLGICLVHGRGIAVDRARALKMFKHAVRCGEDRALPELERLEQMLNDRKEG